ncbi:hypothetical protein [Aurantibacter sp.]|uniref:hypothetical protein n=1 Tax=Aurantibacter sp. TaxID=2807103 RepID=UPI0035C86FFD
MKLILIKVVFSFTLFLGFQDDLFPVNKTFVSKIGTLCEEVEGDDFCAGSTIFLVLKFNKETVLAQEKYISTCDSVSVIPIGVFKWRLYQQNIVLENTEGTFLENLKLEVVNDVLSGKRKNDNNKIISYFTFKEVLSKTKTKN